MRITTLWPDGSLIVAESWDELEIEVRTRQWHKYSVGAFRQEMRRRAQIWADVTIPISTPERMFRALEGCGMVRIEVEDL